MSVVNPWHSDFEIITENILVDADDNTEDGDEVAICGCRPKNGEKFTCYDLNCVNFTLRTECTKCNITCCNNRIQRKKGAKLSVVEAGLKGLGLKTEQDLKIGDFIIEFVGEIIGNAEFLRRKEMRKSEPQYFLSIKNDVYLDTRTKGSIARYINHSCDPNASLDLWNVNGKIKVGVFAVKNIPNQTELTFDYCWNFSSDRKPTVCLCNSMNCRGFIEKLDIIEESSSTSNNDNSLRTGLWRTSNDICDENNNPYPIYWFIGKRIKVYWAGNLSYFEADVLYTVDECTAKVHYLVDDSFNFEKLVAGGDWLWLDETKEDNHIKRKVVHCTVGVCMYSRCVYVQQVCVYSRCVYVQ